MSKPNILYIMTDQQRATSLDLYTDFNSVPTTALRELAAEGTVFDAGYCPYPLCVPSRIAAMTGRYASSTGYIGNEPWRVGDKMENLFTRAHEHGYHTSLIGKDHALALPALGTKIADKNQHTHTAARLWDFIYPAWHGDKMTSYTQRDQPHIQRFLRETPELQTLWGSAVAPWDGDDSISGRMCDVASQHLSEWQEGPKQNDKPFFMWLSFPDPHEFYQCPKDVFESIDPDGLSLPKNWNYDIEHRAEYIQFMRWYFNSGGVPEEVVMQLIRVYLAMCKNIDLQLQKVFAKLKELGEWENTIILYTSDHGDFTGEHQLLQKFNAGYDGCCRVPFIAAWPGRTLKGQRSREPVNLVDIPATLCELTGMAPLPGDQGRSFADILTKDNPAPRTYTVTESGLVGESLSTADIRNFEEHHRWDVEPDGRWCYDPPHRFGGRMYAVRSRDHKLIVRQDQADEFFDLRNDPWETENLARDPAWADEISRHKNYLIDHLSRTQHVEPETTIAPQDIFYRAGGAQTWEEALAAYRAKTDDPSVHQRRTGKQPATRK